MEGQSHFGMMEEHVGQEGGDRRGRGEVVEEGSGR